LADVGCVCGPLVGAVWHGSPLLGGGGVVSRVLSFVVLAVLWVGAVRLIVGAVPAPSLGRMRARVGWVLAVVSSFAAGVLSAVPRRW